MESKNDENQNAVEQAKKKTRKSRKTTKPLPDPRMNVKVQVKILKAICAASDKGSKFVTSQEVAPLASVHNTQAGGVCSFFFKIGMLQKENYSYKPKEAIVTFCNDLEWAPDTASNALKEDFTNSWFGKSIIDYFKVNKEATKDSLIKNLGRVASADSYHKRALSTLVDFLKYANIISYDKSSKKYLIMKGISSQQSSVSEPKETLGNVKKESEKPLEPLLKNDTPKPQQSNNVGATVVINLDVKFSDDTDPKTLAAKINKFKELIK
ncbi:MAG: hypothetical protein ABIE94_01055 [archaeon]